MKSFSFYAPNVHTGGGFVLLRALLHAWPGSRPLTLFLDERVRERLVIPAGARVFWVKATLSSRLKAEFKLQSTARIDGAVLCFHGLPPILSNLASNYVFLQNRLYLEELTFSRFKLKTRLRLAFERLISRVFRKRVTEYIVQTPSMKRDVLRWFTGKWASNKIPSVRVLPVVDAIPERTVTGELPKWDFIYVAHGEAHKNHKNLLAAWVLLAEEGLRPTLVLTLGLSDETLIDTVNDACSSHKLHITNAGELSREEVMSLYDSSSALIFPSVSESFGLPLIEATQLGLPILASEMDYVRDVCEPIQTFDPLSPLSIARAVKRYMGIADLTVKECSPTLFWNAILGETNINNQQTIHD